MNRWGRPAAARAWVARLLLGLAGSLALGAGAVGAGTAPTPRQVTGTVTHVGDGDSLWVRSSGGERIEVRLRDIDAPEICQAWGPQARDALRALVHGRPVALVLHGRDRHRRWLGELHVRDGSGRDVDVAAVLVERGHAWSLRSGRGRGPLLAQERRARAARAGLHAQPGALLPQDFRRRHGPCTAGRVPPTSPSPSAARSYRWATAPR